MKKILFYSLIIAAVVYCNLSAQTDSTKTPELRITLTDGSQFFGWIESTETLHLNFITKSNIKIKIPKDQISDVVRVQDLYLPKKKTQIAPADTIKRPPEIEYEDLNANRMFLFPTAKSMRTGQAYLSFNELFFPFLAFGIEDFVIIGAGSSIMPGSKVDQFYYISPRITPLKVGNFYLAGGVFYSKYFERHDLDVLPIGTGIIYGMTTYEFSQTSLSFGLGWTYSGKRVKDKPMMIFGGETKIGTNTKFIIETWLFNDFGLAVPFIGARFYNKNVCFDIALIKPMVGTNSVFLPWISITYNADFFGNK